MFLVMFPSLRCREIWLRVLEYLLDITLVMYGNFMWKLPDLREKYMYAHIMEFDVSRNGYLLTKTQIWAKTCNVHKKVPGMEYNLTSICKLDPAVDPQCLYVALVPVSTINFMFSLIQDTKQFGSLWVVLNRCPNGSHSMDLLVRKEKVNVRRLYKRRNCDT